MQSPCPSPQSYAPRGDQAQSQGWPQIEIKLRLPDKPAHHKVMALLEKDLTATHHQENFFFDGAKQEITSTRTVLRCRFYNRDEKALLTCKVPLPCFRLGPVSIVPRA